MSKCCSGCGARTRQDHMKKVTMRGVYKHDYNGPGKHLLTTPEKERKTR